MSELERFQEDVKYRLTELVRRAGWPETCVERLTHLVSSMLAAAGEALPQIIGPEAAKQLGKRAESAALVGEAVHIYGQAITEMFSDAGRAAALDREYQGDPDRHRKIASAKLAAVLAHGLGNVIVVELTPGKADAPPDVSKQQPN